ncbi:Rho-binding antiterminator [Pseudoalteromonas sp. MMG005]|uniref:Rho-binding antiterminator n=1 Tax=Pseudoalteromonas sp. MMG005 TaxID=2822682 RepID=UPI001B3A10DC|nr:Rho-binding antiterminator [Pseudoalteromonas sp. MMG005]MBQ4846747.1 Rho-binding antiterminator [Pseudoalteromonas sp. MMG005]
MNNHTRVNQVMTCDDHDFIEIACLYNYSIKITTRSADNYQGRALDTQYNQQRQQCICIVCDEQPILIELDTIAEIHVLTPNPHFNYLRV